MIMIMITIIHNNILRAGRASAGGPSKEAQDSSKGGAVETGCSGSRYMIGCFIIMINDTTPIHCTPLPMHPPVMNSQHDIDSMFK